MRALVTASPVARLATVDAQGRPHVVPICFVLHDEVLYSAVDRKPKRTQRLRRLENLRARPDVAVLVDHYERDWERLWWVRLRGTARVVEEEDERDRALALLAEKYPQYRAEPPTGPVIRVRVEEWSGWSARG